MIQNTGKKEYQALLNRTEKYAEQVRVLFANAVNDILSFSSSVPSLEDGEIFSYSNNKKLAKNASALNNENDALKKENAALKAEQNKRKPALDVTSAAVFFNIGETTLDAQNLFNLDFYYQNVIAQDDNKVIVLTGYADKQTGSKKRNQQLGEKRAQYVYDILRNKYNVPAERIQVKAVGSESEFVKTPAQLNRSVVLE